jgi:hypothetical protein
MKNILVFPCGSEIGLEIYRSLKDSKFFKVFGASSVDDHGKFEFENYISDVPNVNAPNFISYINKLIRSHSIDFIIPAHDSVVVKMAMEQDKLDAVVVTSPYETCRICRSKLETYETFKNVLPTPEIYSPFGSSLPLPIFMKPDIGQGSKGTLKITTDSELMHQICNNKESVLFLEYLPGKEYTIDCFTNKDGQLLFTQGRERKRVQNGISVNSKLVKNPKFRELGELINSKLVFTGTWFFQVKERANGQLVLMEISPRIAGTMELFRNKGVNFTQLSLFDRMGINVSIIHNDIEVEIDRALAAKFKTDFTYDHVYIDLDDTLIINGKVNINMMKFIYQCINNNKIIHLLTKHKNNVEETLSYNYIDPRIFEFITQIQELDEKSDYIKYKNSIFIDDSFSERKRVSDRVGIPVFDIDAIDCLM